MPLSIGERGKGFLGVRSFQESFSEEETKEMPPRKSARHSEPLYKKHAIEIGGVLRTYFSGPKEPDPTLVLERERRVCQSPEEVARRLKNELEIANRQLREETERRQIVEIPRKKPDLAAFPQMVCVIPKMHTALRAMQGRRPTMEDAHAVEQFFAAMGGQSVCVEMRAVFDGHGGIQTARFAEKHFARYLKKYLEEVNKESMSDLGIWNACKLAVVDLNSAAIASGKIGSSGSTLNATVRIGNDLWCINVGDSRALLFDLTRKVVCQLSHDAKPSDLRYHNSVVKRGGVVVTVKPKGGGEGVRRVDGVLAVARALGNSFLPGVTARPKITRVPLQPGSDYLVVHACDGVWDVMTAKAMRKIITPKLKELEDTASACFCDAVAEAIVVEAFMRGSTDNISAVVARISLPGQPDSVKERLG